MENLVQILDLGHSEYRLGFGGDTEYSHQQAPYEKANLNEFYSFVDLNKPQFQNEQFQSLIFIEKNQRNPLLRQRICEHFLEKEKYNAVFFARPATMALYSVGRSTGLVFENSETSCEIVCVEDSYVDQKLIKKSKVSIYDYYKAIPNKQYTLKQFRDSFSSNYMGNVILPDGNSANIKILEDSFNNLLENLFEEQSRLNEMVMLGRVFSNDLFVTPIRKLLTKNQYQILNPPVKEKYEQYGAFIGASIMTQIKNMRQFFVSAQDYEEYGMDIINTTFSQLNYSLLTKYSLMLRMQLC